MYFEKFVTYIIYIFQPKVTETLSVSYRYLYYSVKPARRLFFFCLFMFLQPLNFSSLHLLFFPFAFKLYRCRSNLCTPFWMQCIWCFVNVILKCAKCEKLCTRRQGVTQCIFLNFRRRFWHLKRPVSDFSVSTEFLRMSECTAKARRASRRCSMVCEKRHGMALQNQKVQNIPVDLSRVHKHRM